MTITNDELNNLKKIEQDLLREEDSISDGRKRNPVSERINQIRDRIKNKIAQVLSNKQNTETKTVQTQIDSMITKLENDKRSDEKMPEADCECDEKSPKEESKETKEKKLSFSAETRRVLMLKTVKNINDAYEKLKDKFPDLTEKRIKHDIAGIIWVIKKKKNATYEWDAENFMLVEKAK